ncbi:MAG: hypothetical protein ACJ0QJ_00160 [Flavobacteriales bacterium]
MLTRLLCFLLLGAIVYSQSSKLVIYLNFKINQEYISKELCENREVPKMNCNGKCYLAKQLQKQEEKEKEEKAPIKQRIKIDVLCFLKKPVSNLLVHYKLKDNNLCFNSIDELKKGFLTKVFQPPQFG